MELLKYFKLFCLVISLCYVPCFSLELLTATEHPWSEMIEITCLELTGFKKLGDDTAYSRVIEVKRGDHVSLPCSYCGANDEDFPRVWMRKLRAVNSTMEEYGSKGTFSFLLHYKFKLLPNHTLKVLNVDTSDDGLYVCGNPLEDNQYMFKYNLDVIETNVSYVLNDMGYWEYYNTENIIAANEEIYHDHRFKELLEHIKVKVVSEWDPWQPCDGCAGGIRRRIAKCRVRASLRSAKSTNTTNLHLNDSETLLINSNALSCHSAFLVKWFPDLGSLTNKLPDYMITQKCYDACVKERWKEMALEAKYVLNIDMELGSSLSFDCPETDLTSSVIWKKNGLTINPIRFAKTEDSIKKSVKSMLHMKAELPHAFVDRMNILQLNQVQFDQTGDYMCFVKKSIMKVIHVKVVIPWETERERYYNYWLLTIYTFLVSASIVSMGILWSIMNRHLFIPRPNV